MELVAETKIVVEVFPNGSSDDFDKDYDFGAEEGDYEELDPDLIDDEL